MLGNIHHKSVQASQKTFMTRGGRALRTGNRQIAPAGPIAAPAATFFGRGS